MDEIPRDQLTGALRRGAVKKNVAAIHVSGKLTLLQRKLSNVLLLNAYDTLITNSRHQIDARTLCLMIGYNSNDMETLKQSLKGLAETVAEWDMLDEKGQQEWGVSSLLSYAKLKGGVCEYAYSPALAEKLHDPKVFALINLNIQRRFTSGHALALYENCYRFVRTGSTGCGRGAAAPSPARRRNASASAPFTASPPGPASAVSASRLPAARTGCAGCRRGRR